MFNFRALLALLVLSISSPAIAQTAISALPNGGLLQQSDIVPMVRSGVTMKATPFTWPAVGSLMLSTGTSAPSGLTPVNGMCAGASGGSWTTVSCGNTGTVSSVTFTGDGTVLSSTPSAAVTSNGTVSASLNSQAANTLLSGPSSGASANPTFRAMVVSDLPALSANTLLGSLTATTPSGQAVPSCSAATKALEWTSGTGFSCNSSITAAAVTGETFPSSGNIAGTTDTQTLTNKTISGASNTISNVSLSSIASIANNTLVGNGSGASAAPLAVTLGTNLTLPSSVLTASGTLLNMQVKTSSGTYTPTTGTNHAIVIVQGAGGGGGGTGTGSPGAGGNGSTVSFGSIISCTGGGGSGPGVGVGAVGTCTGGTLNIAGGQGGFGQATTGLVGGNGGVSMFGGAGSGGADAGSAGGTASANSGGGGGGGGGTASVVSAAGGSSGGVAWYYYSSVTSQTVTIGAGGTAGAAGTGGVAGGVGGSGVVIILEFT